MNPKPFALRSERLGVSPSQASMSGPDFHPGIAEPSSSSASKPQSAQAVSVEWSIGAIFSSS
jgi:hypothetical protein